MRLYAFMACLLCIVLAGIVLRNKECAWPTGGDQGHFITYATPAYEPHAIALCESALRVGFRSARVYTPRDIHPTFHEKHRRILGQKRGAGYWLWKPYIIHHALRDLAPGQKLCYCDAMYQFMVPPNLHTTTLFVNKPSQAGVTFKRKWFCKMDALKAYDVVTPSEINARQLWAGCIYLVKNCWTDTLIQNWLEACTDPQMLTDTKSVASNAPSFKDHRHDQALLDLVSKDLKVRRVESPHFLINLQSERPRAQ